MDDEHLVSEKVLNFKIGLRTQASRDRSWLTGLAEIGLR